MEIIRAHYKLSKPVRSYAEIKDEAKALKRFVDKPNLKGYYNKAYAVCHCQVSETPYAFFVVADDVIVEGLLKHRVIINPEIIEAPADIKVRIKDKDGKDEGERAVKNVMVVDEACLSFPYRKEKRMERAWRIKVRYQVPGLFGLKTIEEWKEGVISQIFQHEVGHLNAKNIYFDNEQAIKWWELIGTPKPKGGCSIGA